MRGSDPVGIDLADINVKGLSPEDYDSVREFAKQNLYFFAKGILGYGDLTVRTHKAFCEWMQDASRKRKLGLMPRGHFKTTLNMADIIRRLCINPDERILLLTESAENAEYMLREIKGHILNNKRLQAWFPEIIPKDINKSTWNKKSIVIPRSRSYREPSIDTAGITTKVVSRHYTMIKGDDLISDEAMYSPTVMKKSKDAVNRLISLLVNPREDEIHIIGTRWAYDDVYSHIMESFDYDVFLRKAIVEGDEGPEPFFPQRYTLKQFQEIIENDPDQWATQYANDPMDTAVADFRREWLQYFRIGPDKNLRWEDDEGSTRIQEWHNLRFYMHVDPSMGESPTSDYSGIVVVAVNSRKQIFLIEAWRQRIDPLNLVNKILELYEYYSIKLCSIESNAFQKSLVYFVQDEARRRQTYVRIEPFRAPSHKRKAARIRGALQPLFSTQRIWVRKGLIDFVEEYLKFGKDEHEHLLDALAQGPEFWKFPMDDRAVAHRKRQKEARKVDLGVTGYGA